MGEDQFSYSVCDPGPLCDTATVYITVIDTNNTNNRPPVGNEDAFVTVQDSSITGGSLISNDADPDGDPITISTTPIINPTNGTVVINSNGTIDYTPTAGFIGKRHAAISKFAIMVRQLYVIPCW